MSNLLNNLPLTKIRIFLAKILYFIVKIGSRNDIKLVNREGINFELDIKEGIDLSIYLFGSFQKYIFSNPLIKISKDATIIDIGANIGAMSLQFAKMVPDGKVISFEPTIYALTKLKKNLSLNPNLANRITVVNSFLSSTIEDNAKLKAYSSWRVDKSASDNHELHGGTPMSTDGVGSTTLDRYIQENKITNIQFIKIDTDGHEHNILKGAYETLKSQKPTIIFEVADYIMIEHKIDFTFYINYFNELNYTIKTVEGRTVNSSNYESIIPKKSSIDLLAIPN